MTRTEFEEAWATIAELKAERDALKADREAHADRLNAQYCSLHDRYDALKSANEKLAHACKLAFDAFDQRYDGAEDSHHGWMVEPMGALQSALSKHTQQIP